MSSNGILDAISNVEWGMDELRHEMSKLENDMRQIPDSEVIEEVLGEEFKHWGVKLAASLGIDIPNMWHPMDNEAMQVFDDMQNHIVHSIKALL